MRSNISRQQYQPQATRWERDVKDEDASLSSSADDYVLRCVRQKTFRVACTVLRHVKGWRRSTTRLDTLEMADLNENRKTSRTASGLGRR